MTTPSPNNEQPSPQDDQAKEASSGNRLMSIIGISTVFGVVIGAAIMYLILARFDGLPAISITPPASEVAVTATATYERTQRALNLLDDVAYQDAALIHPNDDAQTIIQGYPAGTTFIFQPGIYRQQAIIPRDGDRFVGQGDVILSGAIVLDDFVSEGDYWVSDDPYLAQLEPIIGGTCSARHPRCNYPHDLYVDDEPLQQVDQPDDVSEDTWFFDYDAGRIYMGINPADRKIELSTDFFAFSGEANDVFISGLTIEKYGGRGQMSAIWANDGQRWIIENNTVRLNSAGGVAFGEGTQILNNRIIQNGQIGLSGEGDDVLVQGNEIAYNNYAGYDAGWEAGGTKFVATDGLIVRDNYVHHNHGQGLWTDIDNINTLYENNLIVYNDGIGLLHEISFDAVIRNNIVKFNHPTLGSVYDAAQIMISSSSNVEVTGNEVVMSEAGGNGIIIIQQNRGSGGLGAYEARNNLIHDNTLVYLSDAGESGAALSVEDAEWFWDVSVNRFENNTHIVSSAEDVVFGWQNEVRTWEEFTAFGQERDSILSTEIPVSAMLVPAWNSQ